MTQTDQKPKPRASDVERFVDSVQHPGRREDARVLLDLMQEVTGEPPARHGSAIGFGSYHYRYESGREGDSVLVGFAPRKANMVVYIMPGFSEYGDLLSKLGKHRTGKSCLYLGRLDAIDLKVLRRLIKQSVSFMRRKYRR